MDRLLEFTARAIFIVLMSITFGGSLVAGVSGMTGLLEASASQALIGLVGTLIFALAGTLLVRHRDGLTF